ncbi:MAG: hypothetical protein NZO58_08560 [Gemmataceae bacterium]|nr:hypothetical protein [Gemmataceae bacterium]
MMRPVWTWSACAWLAAVAGCTNANWGFLRRDLDRPIKGPPPSIEALVAYLNDNAGRVQSLRSDDLHITARQGVVPVTMSGKLMIQKPRNFRMSADMVGKRVVDLGSNDQEFWWWSSQDPQPAQYYCSYQDLQEGRVAALPFPFQPEWIMETLGLGPFGPASKYELEHDEYTLKLIERVRSPQGKPMRKVIVMKRSPQKAPSPQVVEHLLLDDATGREVCSAAVSEAQLDKTTNALLPRRLELRWPEAKVTLDLRLDGLAVNVPLPPAAFVRQPMTGIPSVDVAQRFSGSTQRYLGMNN